MKKKRITIIAYRQKTGCREYCFENWSQFRTWRSRNPYFDEQHRVQIFMDHDLESEFVQPSQRWIDSQGTADAFLQTALPLH